MVDELLKMMVLSLAATILLEVSFAFLYGIRDKKDLLLVVLVNFLTNPAVVFSYYMTKNFTNWNLVLTVLSLELCAILIEGTYFNKYGKSIANPFLFALLINIFSYGTGRIISAVI